MSMICRNMLTKKHFRKCNLKGIKISSFPYRIQVFSREYYRGGTNPGSFVKEPKINCIIGISLYFAALLMIILAVTRGVHQKRSVKEELRVFLDGIIPQWNVTEDTRGQPESAGDRSGP